MMGRLTDKDLDLLEMVYLILRSKDQRARERLEKTLELLEAGQLEYSGHRLILQQILQSLPGTPTAEQLPAA